MERFHLRQGDNGNVSLIGILQQLELAVSFLLWSQLLYAASFVSPGFLRGNELIFFALLGFFVLGLQIYLQN